MSYYGINLLEAAITAPVRKRYLVDIPGGDGSVDLYEGLGQPVYETRTVTAVFQPLSDLQQTVSKLINDLEGRTVNIVLPEDAQHYMTGYIHIAAAGRSGAMSCDKITVTAVCLPWRYSAEEVVHQIQESETAVQYTWNNTGGRDAVPTVKVFGEVLIEIGASSIALSAGTYQMTTLTIPGNGSISVSISGGPAEVRYREAIL